MPLNLTLICQISEDHIIHQSCIEFVPYARHEDVDKHSPAFDLLTSNYSLPL